MDALSTLPWKSSKSTPTIRKDEHVILDSRHHWMKYVPAVFVYVLLFPFCIFLLMIATSLRSSSPEVATVLFFGTFVTLVCIQHWFFHILLSENVTDTVLTNQRMLYFSHRLWFVDSMDELILDKIKMVKIDKNGIMRNLLNYGDLACLFDVDAGKTFLFLPAPKHWSQKIENMIRIG